MSHTDSSGMFICLTIYCGSYIMHQWHYLRLDVVWVTIVISLWGIIEVIAFPEPNKPFIVETDASKSSIGGVLSQQKDDGNIHPIAYFSLALSPTEQNWSTYSQEAYALVMATRQWYVFLAGHKFVLKTDHNPLVHLRSKKDPRGKFARWLSELEEFEYDVE